jgi:hypothetical protein
MRYSALLASAAKAKMDNTVAVMKMSIIGVMGFVRLSTGHVVPGITLVGQPCGRFNV